MIIGMVNGTPEGSVYNGSNPATKTGSVSERDVLNKIHSDNIEWFNSILNGSTSYQNKDFKNAFDLYKLQMAYNAYEAQKNRDFQERMSSTAYQRLAADLKKAGYNPALALNSSAYSASGSSASVGSANIPYEYNAVSALANAKQAQTKSFDNVASGIMDILKTILIIKGLKK